MKFTIDQDSYFRTYKYKFSNLTDLYDYLISNPKVNNYIFTNQASVYNPKDFGGEKLDVAIDYLKGGYNIDFDKFDIAIKAVRAVRALGYEDTDSRKLVRGLYGGTYLAPLVAAGLPDCMIKYERDTSPKHITVYFQLGYSWQTDAKQVFNRGIATINLIQSLEEEGYIVDLKVFELSRCGDEVADITVNIKNMDECLNITKCYYPLVSKEFLRRLLFRVLESAPVRNNWGGGYGSSMDKHEIREFYNLKPKDLIISEPIDMGIKGNNVYEDTVILYETLGLQNEFDLSKIKQKVKKISR